ncbi:hypothetical protein GE118_04235 [Mycoplasma sp. NEAQ87857]|uniref:hypothetical protein n=1 Tax=Mycoplasma sp. NEAQ87857 TaxID=2683967 RepID=UPI00131998B6|nr:hypothetical protein [Mycoplasma sp. NEAQ87857]QGZ97985.1 hypothetical protein GE118_04235 [Mycoplasma sp. NEAQ87857]
MNNVNWGFVRLEYARKNIQKNLIGGQKKVHNWEFYVSGNFVDYITRASAVCLQDNSETNESLMNKFYDSNLDYAEFMKSQVKNKQDNPGIKYKSGLYRLFNESANDIDKESFKAEFKNKVSEQQIIYELTINMGDLSKFTNTFSKQNWNEYLNLFLSKMLERNKMNKNNVDGVWAMHTNSDYPHIHLMLYEKSKFRKFNSFSKDSIKLFKQDLVNVLETPKEFYDLVSTKNSIYEHKKNLRVFFNQKHKIKSSSAVDHYSKLVADEWKKNYSSKNDLIKLSIQDLNADKNQSLYNSISKVKDLLLSSNKDFKTDYLEFKNQITKLSKTNKFMTLKEKDDFISKQSKELDLLIAKQIIKSSLEKDKQNNIPVQQQKSFIKIFNSLWIENRAGYQEELKAKALFKKIQAMSEGE